jgi:hypothetical protein
LPQQAQFRLESGYFGFKALVFPFQLRRPLLGCVGLRLELAGLGLQDLMIAFQDFEALPEVLIFRLQGRGSSPGRFQFLLL